MNASVPFFYLNVTYFINLNEKLYQQSLIKKQNIVVSLVRTMKKRHEHTGDPKSGRKAKHCKEKAIRKKEHARVNGHCHDVKASAVKPGTKLKTGQVGARTIRKGGW